MPSDPDRFSVNPDPAQAGHDITITFTNPSLPAGTVVDIDIDNGQGATATVHVTLGSGGSGSTTWSVPATGWLVVKLNAETSREHVVAVEQ